MDIKKILKELIFLFSALILAFLTKQEILITVILLVFVIISFKIEYQKREIIIFIFGMVTGFLVEITGNYFYKLEHWDKASFFGLPLWLPVLWGIAFIYIRRIGTLIKEE